MVSESAKTPHDTDKVYSLHEPHIYCVGPALFSLIAPLVKRFGFGCNLAMIRASRFLADRQLALVERFGFAVVASARYRCRDRVCWLRPSAGIALARALVLQPNALLMDEPLSNLDEELNQHLRGELLRLHAQLGFALLYVTHDRAEASDIGARIVCMRHGHVERTVPVEEFKAARQSSL